MRLSIQARAKINWTLDVVGTLPNGYHDLDMLMQSVTLCDQMTIEDAPELAPGMVITDEPGLYIDEEEIGIRIGKIESAEDIGRYYMHGVSHHLGIDTHDATGPDALELAPGMVITDEPGLYIDEEAIGIRIEDDLLITEDGCTVLSEAIPRTTEDIEAIMARERRA